jgi:hypothetical protein
MNAEELRDRFRRPAPETAFGGDAERPVGGALCGLDAAACALGPVGDVDQPEVELRLVRQPQIF